MNKICDSITNFCIHRTHLAEPIASTHTLYKAKWVSTWILTRKCTWCYKITLKIIFIMLRFYIHFLILWLISSLIVVKDLFNKYYENN